MTQTFVFQGGAVIGIGQKDLAEAFPRRAFEESRCGARRNSCRR